MASSIKLIGGKVLLTIMAVFTAVAHVLADWNETHIYNPLWLPHAKFHNAQTMVMGVLLALATLFFIWRKRNTANDLLTAVTLTSLYWVSQAAAFLFPGVAWTDPNLLLPRQSLSDFPMQLKMDVIIFFVIGLCVWLMLSGTHKDAEL
jgi:hypothetical protein